MAVLNHYHNSGQWLYGDGAKSDAGSDLQINDATSKSPQQQYLWFRKTWKSRNLVVSRSRHHYMGLNESVLSVLCEFASLTGAGPSLLNQPGLSQPCLSWYTQPCSVSTLNTHTHRRTRRHGRQAHKTHTVRRVHHSVFTLPSDTCSDIFFPLNKNCNKV